MKYIIYKCFDLLYYHEAERGFNAVKIGTFVRGHAARHAENTGTNYPRSAV